MKKEGRIIEVPYVHTKGGEAPIVIAQATPAGGWLVCRDEGDRLIAMSGVFDTAEKAEGALESWVETFPIFKRRDAMAEPEVVDIEQLNRDKAELNRLESERDSALVLYTDNLPYDKNRIIGNIKVLAQYEAVSRIAIGRGLILLQANENVRTFGQILEEEFGGLSRQRANEYMLAARKVMDLPKLREMVTTGKGWCKVLALISTFDEDELKRLDSGESVAGMDLDDVDHMSVRELKTNLRKERADFKCDKAQLAAKLEDERKDNREMAEQIRALKADKPTPEILVKEWEKADQHFCSAVKVMNRFSVDDLRENVDLLVKVSGAVGTMMTMVQNLNRLVGLASSGE